MAVCKLEGDPSVMIQNPEHHRTELNNWLQVNGGLGRLEWEKSRKGPDNKPVWTAKCIVDGDEWSTAEGSTLSAAKEEAARMALRILSFKRMTSTGRFASGG